MLTTELITRTIELHEGTSALDAGETGRRARILIELQRVFSRLWRARDWPFRQVTSPSTVTVPDGVGYIVVPATFDGLGRQGGVYHTTDKYRLLEKPFGFIRDRQISGVRTSSPRWFAIYGQDATTFRDLLQIDVNDGAVGLSIIHNRVPPTLVDDTANPGSANDALIKQFPEKYHEIVLQPLILAKLSQLRGELAAELFEQEFNLGVNVMLRNEQPEQSGMRQLPSFFGS